MDILFTASANGGSRHVLEALKLKRMGVSKGYPDVAIEVSNKTFHGLRIELKRVSLSNTTPEQIEWQSKLRKNGYCSEIAYGFEEAKRIVIAYLNNTWCQKPMEKVKSLFDEDMDVNIALL